MAIIQEYTFFSWRDLHNDLQNLGDLERFKLVIETIPDQKLMAALHTLRGRGRDDHPIVAMWNSLLAGIIFEHVGVESLRRELKRNAQLRELCGFNPLKGVDAVPSKSAYNRFFANLISHEFLIRELFDSLVKELMLLLPHFGSNLAGDGKPIPSFGAPSKKRTGDRRREEEADWGLKNIQG